jgi:hypothetical protein
MLMLMLVLVHAHIHTHTCICLRWSYIISSRLYFDAGVSWLVAPAMMYMPFIGDIMRCVGEGIG